MEADKFSSIAERYDLANFVLSFGRHFSWKKRLVEAAEIGSGERVLDLCAGTGDVAVLAVKEKKTAEVTASDANGKMLALAREKARREDLKIDFAVCDARKTPFPDGYFDVVLISFGVRNVENWERDLLPEIKRILKPDGRFLFLEFLPPRGFFGVFYDFYLKFFVPLFGWLTTGHLKPYRHLAESVRRFPDDKAVKEILEKSGFGGVAAERICLGVAAIYRCRL
ncbi:MAG: ubiquinone/menaquinone biosynthesis methyltransferase [Parcubacteria group bacterium]|nr:ubiquinone/menaquinone biosynthesis methyltransferase [Parcubacteria group bacterium]